MCVPHRMHVSRPLEGGSYLRTVYMYYYNTDLRHVLQHSTIYRSKERLIDQSSDPLINNLYKMIRTIIYIIYYLF
jgi:hypothetical protein